MIHVESPSLDPFFHFALEYYLLFEKKPERDYFLFWRTEPTLMVGRYQNTLEELDTAYAGARGLRIVRRLSGGGTIYTDPNTWQFSFIRSRAEGEPMDFRPYMAPVAEALNGLGVRAEFSSRNDLCVGGRKISGNAQYSSRGRTLHHGSLLFDADLGTMEAALRVRREKIESKGIKSVRGRVANIREYVAEPMDSAAFRDRMLCFLLPRCEGTETLPPEELRRVGKIADGKFRPWEWNFGASPRCDLVRSARFEGGRVEFRLHVENGEITSCAIAGDFFAGDDVGRLERALAGCRFRREDAADRLREARADGIFFRITSDELLDCLFGGGAPR